MTPDQMLSIAEMAVIRFPDTRTGPDDLAAVWLEAFERYDAGTFSDAIYALSEEPGRRRLPAHGEIVATLRALRTRGTAHVRTFTCDGTAWLPSDQGMVPCPDCNPVLAGSAPPGSPMPPRCQPAEDENVISLAAGREAAAAAYLESEAQTAMLGTPSARARRAWWKQVRAGEPPSNHYPGCGCDRCTAGLGPARLDAHPEDPRPISLNMNAWVAQAITKAHREERPQLPERKDLS